MAASAALVGLGVAAAAFFVSLPSLFLRCGVALRLTHLFAGPGGMDCAAALPWRRQQNGPGFLQGVRSHMNTAVRGTGC